jgi:hypothetical protein
MPRGKQKLALAQTLEQLRDDVIEAARTWRNSQPYIGHSERPLCLAIAALEQRLGEIEQGESGVNDG